MSISKQAPGELEHVRAFVNTLDPEDGSDGLDRAAALDAWLGERGLVPPGGPARATRADLNRARRLREALRALLIANNEGGDPDRTALAVLDRAGRDARLGVRFTGQRAHLEPGAPGAAGGLGRLLAIAAAAMADGSWSRLKACRERTCGWAFYDHSRNRSGAWCSMAVCGNRTKVKSYRRRRQREDRGC